MNRSDRKIQVCLSPDLLHLFDISHSIVVIVDILRATSCMVTALAHGIKDITPVATLEECQKLKAAGMLTAAERDGKKADGFDLGNSPFAFMDPMLKGQRLAMTTTNGTQAIVRSAGAKHIFIGAFLNISALASRVRLMTEDIVIVCAGWKGSVNAEDSYFAGALCDMLSHNLNMDGDAALMAHSMFKYYEHQPMALIEKSSHYLRLRKLGIMDDIIFCLRYDVYNTIPKCSNGLITA
jgi:2-phosphosulfolactate phosphatase